jgi:hypothetical protein
MVALVVQQRLAVGGAGRVLQEAANRAQESTVYFSSMLEIMAESP